MIMKTLRYIALAALTLSFAACEQEDINPAVQGDPDAVKINATIGNMQTRVAYSGDNGVTNFVNGDAIKVVNLMRTSKNEATYTTTDGTNWTTADAMVWNSTSKNKFQAYYPVAEYSSYDMFTIPTDQSDATKLASADWMTASTGEIDKPGNGVLDLNFQHRLAKVTVNLTFSSQYPEGYQHVSDFTFYTNEETQQAITPLANSETLYTAILRPGEYADEDDFIYLEMDNFDEHYVLGKTTTSAINLEAGKHYKFSLKVGKDVVSIDDVTVADWNKEEINGGVAEELIPTEYDATTKTYKVYQGEYLQTAFDEAEQTGTTENPATVKIMRDMEVTGIPNKYGDVEKDLLMDAGEIVLDLNGHTLTGKTGSATIKIDNGAKLTIDDSSESKLGKIQNLLHYAVYVCDESTLVVNNGTFEGECAVYSFDSPTIIINGGTFQATLNAIKAQTGSLTITSGTFEGEALALSLGSTVNVSIVGGCFTGGKYDIYTGFKTEFLSFNDDGVGPSFPGGLSIKKDRDDWSLNSLLVEGAGYYVGEELQTLDANAASCEGDVTVKKIPTDE